MQRDAFGLDLTAASAAAAKHYDDTVSGYLGFRRDVGDHLKATFTADPTFAMAHCLKGYFYLLFCNPALDSRTAKTLADAESAATVTNATERERTHIAALSLWAKGDLSGAAARWETILADHPRDVIALKLSHFAHFYGGDARKLRDSVARVLPGWSEKQPGYGYVLGMLAFGLEESGDYAAAEEAGRKAVALSAGDIWAVHAVAHVYEMTGWLRDGIRWLRETEAGWKDCNNFAYHVWWHRALFHLELGEHEETLALYDARVRGDQSEDYLDIANGVALLWRLENAGVNIGNRWVELADKVEKRLNDHVLAFIDAHYAMALAWAGRVSAAQKLAEGARAAGAKGDTSQAPIHAKLGAPLCEAIAAYRGGTYAQTIDRLMPIRYALDGIGGSHAQRDLFHQLLLAAALKAKDYKTARALAAERVQQKRRSPSAWRAYGEALVGAGDKDGAARAQAEAERLRTQ